MAENFSEAEENLWEFLSELPVDLSSPRCSDNLSLSHAVISQQLERHQERQKQQNQKQEQQTKKKQEPILGSKTHRLHILFRKKERETLQ